MTTVNIHIGAGKCGSSLIQRLINEADVKEVLSSMTTQPHLSSVLMTYTPCFDFEDYNYQHTMQGLKGDIPLEDSLYSCENLVGMHTHREPTYKNSVKLISYLFDKFDKIRILLYVRRQDDWLEAMYAQDVKRQETRPFDEYADGIIKEGFNWKELADALSEKFELTVMPFERKMLQEAGHDTFIHGFFNWLGVEVKIENLPVVNPSLSKGGQEVQMLANKVLPKEEAYSLSYWLEKHAPKEPGDKFDYFANREEFLDQFRVSNEALFKEYMPDFNPAYYLE